MVCICCFQSLRCRVDSGGGYMLISDPSLQGRDSGGGYMLISGPSLQGRFRWCVYVDFRAITAG